MRQEVDIRCVVTSLKGSEQHLYENVYCQRGQMENLIVRAAIPPAHPLARAEFATDPSGAQTEGRRHTPHRYRQIVGEAPFST
jgi:hypothetical protein